MKRVLYVNVNPEILSVEECAQLFHISSPEKAVEFREWAKTAAPGTVWSQWLFQRKFGGVRGTAVMLAEGVPVDMELG